MCRRYSRAIDLKSVVKRWNAEPFTDDPGWWGHYTGGMSPNIAPRRVEPIILQAERRRITLMEWGLVPERDRETNPQAIVPAVEVEVLAGESEWKKLLPERRCIIPATGFYEWNAEGQPYNFQLKDGGLFALAGLWERHVYDLCVIDRFSILTTAANALVGQVHDRMPAILSREAGPRWLDPKENDPKDLLPLLRPFAADKMKSYPVTPAPPCAEVWDFGPEVFR